MATKALVNSDAPVENIQFVTYVVIGFEYYRIEKLCFPNLEQPNIQLYNK
jgi:hypothetical protein